jgi:hypothetical protein
MSVRISAEVVVPNWHSADCAADELRALGYTVKVYHDRIDLYSAAVFLQATCEVDADDWMAGADIVLDELDKVVGPLGGLADDAGPAEQ